jgi:hypothetical protein
MGFELTIPVFERAKTFHALDRAATVIGISHVFFFPKFLLTGKHIHGQQKEKVTLCL